MRLIIWVGLLSISSRTSALVKDASMLIGLIALCVAALLVFTLVPWASSSQHAAIAAPKKRLDLVLEAELKRARTEFARVLSERPRQTVGTVSPDDSAPLILRMTGAWQFDGFEAAYALNRSGNVILGSAFGQPLEKPDFLPDTAFVQDIIKGLPGRSVGDAEQSASHDTAQDFKPHSSLAGYVHQGSDLALAVVAQLQPATDTGTAQTIVAIRRLTASKLRELGEHYGLGHLSFSADGLHDPDVSVPVSNARGEHIGHLSLAQPQRGTASTPNHLPLFLAGMASVLTALLLAFRRLKMFAVQMGHEQERADRLASHDDMSGLFNRRGFNERVKAEINRCTRGETGFAVHMLDLDRFKDVNDRHGHQAGDEVIREVARRISNAVRGADIVARLGGDEFGILQIETETTIEAGALANRLRDALNRPIAIGGTEITIGCSIGITLAPVEGADVEGLMKLADSALYQAKSEGRNRYRFFEQSLDANLKMKHLVAEELRDAIAHHQLELHYQPQVSADGQRILGVEALVRWRHPVRGLIPPLEFISLAEERGLIVPLSNWVLRRACEDALKWNGINVSVNVSATEFKQANYVENLVALVAQTGLDLTRLELELTESMIVQDEDKAEKIISTLRSHGISLALDDFGTGYSSLIYLRRFSFDKIKIDRSFLEAMETTGESAILVHSVVHLGRALGLTVCAEGIETDEQHRFLQAVGCHELQGYLFSKPVPAAQITEMLTKTDPFKQVA